MKKTDTTTTKNRTFVAIRLETHERLISALVREMARADHRISLTAFATRLLEERLDQLEK